MHDLCSINYNIFSKFYLRLLHSIAGKRDYDELCYVCFFDTGVIFVRRYKDEVAQINMQPMLLLKKVS